MTYRFSKNSYSKMVGVRPELVSLATRALLYSDVDFGITEGLRSKERQRALVARGASRTMNSRHITGHALDVGAWVDGRLSWDWPLYLLISEAWAKASEELGIRVRWGGTWQTLESGLTMADLHKSFPDGPHYELPREDYP